MIWLFLAQVTLILVHGPTGQEIQINTAQISTIRRADALPDEHLAPGVNCILIMTNGKQVNTRESCEEIIISISKGGRTI